MSLLRRTALTAALVVTLGTVPAISPSPSPTLTPAAAALPTAAIAVGDSFISGEGAGSYAPVTDVSGVSRSFPGWTAPNSNAFFCHRSNNASIHKANLPGITARFNLACSGAQPPDIANPSSNRAKGRQVASQISQVQQVAQTHDIDVVLVGLGSNNSSFTFGDVALTCATRFIADAWTGWWEFWAYLNGPVPQQPCSNDDLATTAQFDAASTETVAALRQLLTTLRAVDADGQHRIVLQDYTNPLPFDLAANFHDEENRTDSRDKFRALGSERYAAGCPVHRASLAPGHVFSTRLGAMVQSTFTTLRAEFPNADLVYLNVQQALNGGRLCEQANSPAGTLATPIRLMDGPTGVHLTSLSGYDKIDIQRIANPASPTTRPARSRGTRTPPGTACSASASAARWRPASARSPAYGRATGTVTVS